MGQTIIGPNDPKTIKKVSGGKGKGSSGSKKSGGTKKK